MNTKRIFDFYHGASVTFTEVSKLLENFTQNINNSKDYANYARILSSSKTVLTNTQELFCREFPIHFKDVYDDKEFNFSAFYKLTALHPEILSGCENLFFNFISEHVSEKIIQTQRSDCNFNWYWEDIYYTLSNPYIIEFITQNQSSEFRAMLLNLAQFIDLIKDANIERAIIFFEGCKSLEAVYPEITKDICKSLEKNPYRESWVNHVKNSLLKIKKEVPE